VKKNASLTFSPRPFYSLYEFTLLPGICFSQILMCGLRRDLDDVITLVSEEE
jgi:hypothetical protein